MCYQFLDDPGETLTICPGVEHVVLIGPKGEMSTHKFGDKNPTGRDWCPASENFVNDFEEMKGRLRELCVELI